MSLTQNSVGSEIQPPCERNVLLLYYCIRPRLSAAPLSVCIVTRCNITTLCLSLKTPPVR